MANPRLVYNGINLDFPEKLSDRRPRDVFRGHAHTSDGAVTETVRSGWWESIEIAVERFDSASFWRGLHAWWAWACRGKQYSFADDSAKTVNTTLSNNESAAATVIELPTTTGIVVGDEYLIRSADLTKWERVVIQSISAGVSVTLVSPGLVYAYSAGDTFRDPLYWPKLTSADREQPFNEMPIFGYELRHRAIEDRA